MEPHRMPTWTGTPGSPVAVSHTSERAHASAITTIAAAAFVICAGTMSRSYCDRAT